MMTIGIGGLVGLGLGIAVAGWLGIPNDAAYYSVVTFGVLVGSVIGKLVTGNSRSSDE